MTSRSFQSEAINRGPEPPVLRIMLVEDNPGDVALVRCVLDETAILHSITVAYNGEEAVAMLDRSHSRTDPKPDLILLDINLPKQSGFHVLRRVRSNPAFDSMIVNMLTSSQNEHDVDTAYRLGANAYTLKQPDLDQACEVLTRMVRYWSAFTFERTKNANPARE